MSDLDITDEAETITQIAINLTDGQAEALQKIAPFLDLEEIARKLLLRHLGTPCPTCGGPRTATMEASVYVKDSVLAFLQRTHGDILLDKDENGGTWLSLFQAKLRAMRCDTRECPDYGRIWIGQLQPIS